MPLSGGLFDKFVENYAAMPPLRGIGFKDRSFGETFLGKEVPKPFFDCGGAGCRIISGYCHTLHLTSDDIPRCSWISGPITGQPTFQSSFLQDRPSLHFETLQLHWFMALEL